MSIGIGGSARLVIQDELHAVYEYYAYDLNNEQLRNSDRCYDGLITVEKSCFPKIQIKEKGTGNREKESELAPVSPDVNYSELILSQKIIVNNSQFCWKIMENRIGYIAMHLLFRIFERYREDSELPEKVSYHV